MDTIPTTLSASSARNNFYTILEEVSRKLKRFTITRRGKAQAVVMHPSDVAAWEETMEILSDGKLLKEINQAEKELKKGKFISEDQLLKSINITKKDFE